MPLADDLGNLILGLNPYTNRNVPHTNPVQTVGDMDPYCRNPSPGTAGIIDQIEVDSDGPYRQEWTFKGEPQKVSMAYRVKYRFPVTKPSATGGPTITVWLEDYMLIGFEGSMGG